MRRPSYQYEQIAQQIKNGILDGAIAPGGRLESERVLGQMFQVQRNTIRQALALLEREGHILTEGRRGSFVMDDRKPPVGDVLLMNVPSGSPPNISALVEGFNTAAEQNGFRVRRTSNDPLPESNVNRVPDPEVMPEEIAGLLIWPHFPTDPAGIKRLQERLPVVLVDQRIMGVTTDSVRSDDLAGGKMITRHLLDHGHRRIAFLTDEVFAETVQSRWQGYVLAHEEAGTSSDPRLSLLYQFIEADIFEPTMRRLWKDPDLRPTAVVCSNDVVAFGLLRFLMKEGIRVPEDIAVTGYGNSTPEYTAAVSLTTVDQPFEEIGREAARLLCKRIRQSGTRRVAGEDVMLPVQLVVRGSTG